MSSDVRSSDQQSQLKALYAQMEPDHLYPLWESLHALVPRQPDSAAVPHKWTYSTARSHLVRAGDLISAHQAERRVLILENPGLPGHSGITPSLYAGLQLILPGEVAPAHRHSQCALRFVLEGEGAYTSVDGEKAVMSPFDLVLTPGGQWHDHGNETDAPMIWLDGLDIPTVRHFDAGFAEQFPEPRFPEAAPPDDSLSRYGQNLRPFRGRHADRRPAHQPLFHYPYSVWKEALAALGRSGAALDPQLGHALEFRNPADGGSIMPTISAHVRLIPAGVETQRRRSTDGTIFVVVEGTGSATIEGRSVALQTRDILVVPSWNAVQFAGDTDLVLFGYSDRAAQEKLNLYRDEDL